MGVFGAAAASGKLLGLNVDQMVNALGIALSQAAGNRQCIIDGALTKRLQAGQAASTGVLAALLAREGLTGARQVFLGQFGFFRLYQPDGYDAAKLTEDLGQIFRGDELSFKPYACGRPQHAILDAAISVREHLRLGNDLEASDVAEVSVTCPATTVDEQFRGALHKRRPTQIVEAQFALPYLIAAALVHGRVGITEVADIHNVRVLDIAARIAGVPGERQQSGVAVSLRDGRKASATAGQPLGAPDNRLSADQLATKFADCAANAVRPVSDDAVRAAIRMMGRPEDLPNISELLDHFV